MEEQVLYGTSEHELPNYLEKVQSQLPALHLLTQIGWKYLTPEETVNLRAGRLGSAILEPILADHLRTHCRYEFKGDTHPFTENAIQNAVQILKGFRATGTTHQNEQAYDLLCLGISVPQTVEGDIISTGRTPGITHITAQRNTRLNDSDMRNTTFLTLCCS